MNKNSHAPTVNTYARLNLFRLEELKAETISLRKINPNSAQLRHQAELISCAIQNRCRQIKQKVMDFELTNEQYLLIYASTDKFYKIAGHSAIFFAQNIAPQIGRRCHIRPDTDHYFPSKEGVISVRDLDGLELQLKNVNINLVKSKTTAELRFYKLPQRHTAADLAKLKDAQATEEAALAGLPRPKDPLPELYIHILELNELTQKAILQARSDFERREIFYALTQHSHLMLCAYHNYLGIRDNIPVYYELQPLKITVSATNKPISMRAKTLLEIYVRTHIVHDNSAWLAHINGISRELLGQILEKNSLIQKMASRRYVKLNAAETKITKNERNDTTE